MYAWVFKHILNIIDQYTLLLTIQLITAHNIFYTEVVVNLTLSLLKPTVKRSSVFIIYSSKSSANNYVDPQSAHRLKSLKTSATKTQVTN